MQLSKNLFNKVKNTLDNANTIKLLKDDLVGEYEAIGQYTEHLTMIDDKSVIDKLTEIRNEEEVHAKELMALIKTLEGGESNG